MTTKALAKFTAELCYESFLLTVSKWLKMSAGLAGNCYPRFAGKPVRIIHDVILQGDAPKANIFGSIPAKRLAP